jgi:hypothetical protein
LGTSARTSATNLGTGPSVQGTGPRAVCAIAKYCDRQVMRPLVAVWRVPLVGSCPAQGIRWSPKRLAIVLPSRHYRAVPFPKSFTTPSSSIAAFTRPQTGPATGRHETRTGTVTRPSRHQLAKPTTRKPPDTKLKTGPAAVGG